MKSLNLEETRLKEEMKSRCLNKGQYIDENAKAKFNMLCHLEDFEIQYWNLEQQNQKYKEVIDKSIEKINYYKIYCEKNKGFDIYTDIEIEAIEPVISELEDILKEVE